MGVHLRTWGEAQAEKYLNQLEQRFLDLASDPAKGEDRTEIIPDYRCYHEGKHLIFYRAHADGIAVARVLHESMDIPGRLESNSGL